MGILFNKSGGELFNTFFENIMSFDFPALNVTFQVSAQDEIFSKSLFNMAAVSAGSVPFANRVVSAANIKISLFMSLTISFM